MSEYREFGYTHNRPRHTFGYLMAPLLSMLDKESNKCILDLGCGNGYLVNFLVKDGYNAYGTDASENGIAIAKQENSDRFFLQDLTTGQLPKELQELSFDTIITTEVIEHLYDPEGFIDFCKQSLQKNGEIIVSTPYHGYLKNLVLSIFNKWDTHMNPIWYGGHIKFFSRRTLTILLTNKGFTDITFKGCGRIPYMWKSMIIKARLV